MKRLLPFLTIVVLAAAAAAVTLLVVIKQEMERSTVLRGPITVEVRPGQSLRELAARLREANLIGSERIFLWAAAWHGVDRTIKHGLHEFEGEVSLTRTLAELTRVPKPVLRVTIPEGLTIREIGALLERAGATDAAAYRAVACSPELRQIVETPPAAPCAEGYLFPDTYDLKPGMSPGAIVDLQIRRFQAVVPPLIAASKERSGPGTPVANANAPTPPPSPAASQGLSWVLTLASIVEKETGLAAERPRIAAVFYNRLRARMPLQTDPTVIYGVIESGAPWDGNLTRAHLRTPHPYNTYIVKDLPPGPICNPGRAAIEAVLRPDSSKEYYFVARGDGSHEFTANLADHNRAVRRYQLR